MGYSSSDAPATDFAITTVNVPDRLDLREIDDRRIDEDGSRLRGVDAAALRAWLPRITIIIVLFVLAVLLWQVVDNWRASLAPEALSTRLTASLGVPIKVESTQFALSPSPRLILTKVTLNNEVELRDIAVRLTTRHVAEVFHGQSLAWAEAAVGASSVTLAQGHDLLQLLTRLDTALPRGLGVIRFSEIQVSDEPWLKGNWRVDLERAANGHFTQVQALQNSSGGSMQVVLTPESPETVGFELHASHWVLPFGFSTPVESASAEGKASYALLEISKYSLSGPFGEAHGSLQATNDSGWKIDGSLQSDGVDLDALLRQVAPPVKRQDGGESEGGGPTMAQGLATVNGKIDGKGASLLEAAQSGSLVSKVNVRSAVLNGINLGYIAVNPSANPDSSGGSTRFASLDAVVVNSHKKTTVRDLRARAGALLALGEIDINENNEISGIVHVDLGTTRVLAPIRVHVHGTLSQPKFGR
jgi:hypothetical protein